MESPTPPATEPWEALAALLDAGGGPHVAAFVDALAPSELPITLARLSEAHRNALLTLLPVEQAAHLIADVSDAQAAGLIEAMPPDDAAEIVNELPHDEQADLLGDLSEKQAEAILAEMAPAEAQEARRLSQYADDVVGGLMVTEFVAFPWHHTVSQVVEVMRARAEAYRDYQVQYAYVTNSDGKLLGVLPLRDLLLANRERPIGEIMITSPLSVSDSAPLEEVHAVFDAKPFVGVPVVDVEERLIGVVHRAAVEAAWSEEAESRYRKSQGIVQEELRTMPTLVRSRRRLAWLSINIVLNMVAASVIALFQETLAQVIALAVFLPIISDMSGCSGNQAVAVSMRELTLGLIRANEVTRVLRKELLVGIFNGLVLGALVAMVAWAWKGNAWLGVVVGSAMAANTLLAVLIGGSVPLMLKGMRMDPALASGPILTTITDMCGFLLVLGLATLLLPQLTG